MIILTIRTDKPEAEIGLYEDGKQLQYVTWEAHRALAETLHQQIAKLLESGGRHLQDIAGIVVYAGPGSFTGLRIGVSVANTLAYSLGIPIVGTTDQWLEEGIAKLTSDKSDKIVSPQYGSPAHITQPKK